MQQFNRQDRRRMRRCADSAAALMAATALKPGGHTCAVTDPIARRVLTNGFAAMIREGCTPVVQRITDKEAASLPGYCRTPQGAQWFAAFGLDVDGRGTWVTRWSITHGLSPEEARDLIEVRLLSDLARNANVTGLPMEVQQ